MRATTAAAIVSSRWGRAFVAVRDSEVASAAMGVSVARYKVLAFTISARVVLNATGSEGGRLMAAFGVLAALYRLKSDPQAAGQEIELLAFDSLSIGALGLLDFRGRLRIGSLLLFVSATADKGSDHRNAPRATPY